MIRRPSCQIRIVALRHHRDRLSLAMLNWQFLHRSLSRRDLVAPANWMIDSRAANRAVKDSLQPFLTGMVEVAEHALEVLLQSCFRSYSLPWQCCLSIHNLGVHNHAHTIGIQKTPLNIDDGFPVPVHDQIWLFCHFCNNDCQQIFLSCCSDKLLHIFWADHHCHPLLRLRNRDFCTVKSLVFERYLIKVNFQPICQFTNSHTDTAGPKVIGFLDETSHIAIAEETLNLALLNSISFLYFRASRLHRRSCLHL